MKKIPNILSFLRIGGAAVLLFLEPFSVEFYVVLVLSSLTDVFDGYIARERHCETLFGAKLDSAADLVLIFAVLSRLFSENLISGWMFIWISAIALVKVTTAVFGFVKYHSLSFLHTFLNKAAGVSLMLFPFLLFVFGMEITAAICCTICSFAAVEELLLTLTSPKLDFNKKTILKIKKKIKNK